MDTFKADHAPSVFIQHTCETRNKKKRTKLVKQRFYDVNVMVLPIRKSSHSASKYTLKIANKALSW